MCARACCSGVGDEVSPAYAASASRPRVSDSPISPWTHESGPTSKSGDDSRATAEDFMLLTEQDACEGASASYTLKPATELRSSAANFVSWLIDTFVCLVPSVVFSGIFRVPCM